MSRPRQFNRDDVLEKAMQIFWSQGFAGTSIQDLVKATGLNRGSLYGAFQDKENLYAEALDRYLGTEMQRCHSALKSGAPLKPVLRDLFLSNRAHFRKRTDASRLFCHEHGRGMPAG